MIAKAILGAVATALLATGSLGMTASTAAAHYRARGSDNPAFAQNCRPIYQRVEWYDDWGNLHVANQYAGQKCWPVTSPRYYDDRNSIDRGGDGDRGPEGDDYARHDDGRDGWDRSFGRRGGWSFGFGFGD